MFGKSKEEKLREFMEHMQKGSQYFEKGDYDAAIAELKKAKEKKPDKKYLETIIPPSEVNGFLADVHKDLGAAYSRKGLTLSPSDPKFKELYSLALEEYKTILKYDPDNAEAYNNIGACQRKLGDQKGAIESRKKSLDLNPDYPESYVNLADSLLGQKEYEQAIEASTSAIKLRNNYPEAYFIRALAYREIKEFTKAAADFNKAIEYKKNYTKAYWNCGSLYSDHGEHELAADYFINALLYAENDIEKAYIHNSFAISLFKSNKNKNDLALNHFNEALKLNKNLDFMAAVEDNIRKLKANDSVISVRQKTGLD